MRRTRCVAVKALIAVFIASVSFAAETIRGRVVDEDGHPVPHVELELFDTVAGASLGLTESDIRGEFAFEPNADGDLLLLARTPGHAATAQLVPATERAAALILRLNPVIPELATKVNVVESLPRAAASSKRHQFAERAVEDAMDFLQFVPGLVVAQHAGGGKSEQYLIRGFDADHGTDLALTLDGIPVNVVSHAHGQGYADLGFVIPETLQEVEIQKGPYFAKHGNLATAGAVSLRLRERFEESFVKIQTGSFGTRRAVLAFSPEPTWTRGFLAMEHQQTDGPFTNAQRLKKLNVAARFRFDLPAQQSLSILATANRARWNASGQIPLREVSAGRLDRFGAIDPTEGGETSRYNVSITHRKLFEDRVVESQLYAFRYALDLFSNFTFFATDQIDGDGILQTDERSVVGGRLHAHQRLELGALPFSLTAGADWRHDAADVGLFRQRDRNVLATTMRSRVRETNLGIFAEGSFEVHPRLRAILGLRHDHLRFDVEDRAGSDFRGKSSHGFTGLKVSWIYTPGNTGSELFLNYGRGFHSNDARSVVQNGNGRALAGADGYEIGYRRRIGDRLELGLAYWWLDLEGELTWVGDEGVTELRGPTRRRGPEAELTWKASERLLLDTSLFLSRGRFRESGEMIARAPRFALQAGAVVNTDIGLSAHARVRHVADDPIVEDGSVLAEGYTVADVDLRYALMPKLDVVLDIENLFDVDVKEAQTYFASRLRSEAAPVLDNHFTPGNPFTLTIGFEYRF